MGYFKRKEQRKRDEIMQLNISLRERNKDVLKEEVRQTIDYYAPHAGRAAGKKMSRSIKDLLSNNEKERIERNARERYNFTFLVIICVVLLLLLIFI